MKAIKKLWKLRKANSHKGDNGNVLVIGGSKNYVGAVALAGVSALNSGADVVKIASTEKVAWAINSLSPDLITTKFKGDYLNLKHMKKIIKMGNEADAVLIGNGLGLKSKTFVQKIVKNITKPLVIDADAIKSVKNVKNAVLTPHPKEFEIYSGKKLTGNIKKDIKILQKCAGTNVILLKGKIDIIVNKNKYKINKIGNPGMTKAGTGDVLAGLCVGLISQGMDPFLATYEASKINGKVGNALKNKKGYSFLASDLAKKIKTSNYFNFS